MTVRRLSRIWVGVDVAHDGGEEAAEELGKVALARVERAMSDEGAETFGSCMGVADAVGPLGDE
jgi:hypothetical protein